MLDRALVNLIELIIALAPVTHASTSISSTNLFPVWYALGLSFHSDHPFLQQFALHMDSRQKLPVRNKSLFLVPKRCIDNYLQDLANDSFHLAPSARFAVMGFFECILMDCIDTFTPLFADPTFTIIRIDYHLIKTVQSMQINKHMKQSSPIALVHWISLHQLYDPKSRLIVSICRNQSRGYKSNTFQDTWT